MSKEEKDVVGEETEWDVKKIFVGIVFIFSIIVGGYYIRQEYFPTQNAIEENPYEEVKGVQTEKEEEYFAEQYSVKNITSGVQKNLESLSQQVNTLSPQEIATSSPQVQKVLQDIKNLEKYPKNQAKEMCINICNGL